VTRKRHVQEILQAIADSPDAVVAYQGTVQALVGMNVRAPELPPPRARSNPSQPSENPTPANDSAESTSAFVGVGEEGQDQQQQQQQPQKQLQGESDGGSVAKK
jgi:hypothetical protein